MQQNPTQKSASENQTLRREDIQIKVGANSAGSSNASNTGPVKNRKGAAVDSHKDMK